ncbi:MAG: LysR substrate-binding domain-containing protein, partial [Perlucidibaca sp.]
MQDFNDLFFYVKVVEHGGFAPAGRALNVPKSSLSRRIAMLEARLGVRLIQRTSRRFMVTDIGQEYFQHCRAMLVEAEAAQEVIERNRAEPQGLVRVTCPSAMLHFQLGEMIARFMARHPKVKVYVEIKNRRVDLVREGFDLAVRVRFPPLEDSEVVARPLAISTQCLVAHPALLGDMTPPLGPGQLQQLPSVALGAVHDRHVWQLFDRAGAEQEIVHQPRMIANDMASLHFAAVQGIGVAQLPTMMVRHQLKAGTLVNVMPDWAPRSGIVPAAFPSRRGLLPAVR